MIDWTDEGVVLSRRAHGETSAIVEVFCAGHGRVAGVVRGGASRRMAPVLEPGSQVAVRWRARVEGHLGRFEVEPVRSRAAQVLGDRRALAGLNGLCALVRFGVPEREACADFYRTSLPLFDLLGQEVWPLAYLRWEMALLAQAGFGLDLSRCAVVGAANDLSFVSPRTGRAVSRAGAGKWADRLLPLPPVMLGEGGDDAQVVEGLLVTGHFLHHHMAVAVDRAVPEARGRLIDLLARG